MVQVDPLRLEAADHDQLTFRRGTHFGFVPVVGLNINHIMALKSVEAAVAPDTRLTSGESLVLKFVDVASESKGCGNEPSSPQVCNAMFKLGPVSDPFL